MSSPDSATEPSLYLTVLGSSPSAPNPNGAGSGYLVTSRGARVLLDCGPGVVGRLRAQMSVADLDAVVVSHVHLDHCVDLVFLRYGLKYFGWRDATPLRVYVPPDARRFLADLGRAIDGNPGFFADVFDLVEYEPDQELEIGDGRGDPTGHLTLRLCPVQHYVPSFAMLVQASGCRLAYSADAAPCPELVDAARNADLFLCEATLASPEEDSADPTKRGHLRGDEAGRLAREAGARRLLLTHFPVDGGARRLEAARLAFGPRVGLVREGRTYRV